MKCIIIGAGGHGRIILEILRLNDIEVAGFIDDSKELYDTAIDGVKVLGNFEKVDGLIKKGVEKGIVAVADGRVRRMLVERSAEKGLTLIGAKHPQCYVSDNARISETAQLCVNCVVNPHAVIGDYTIINSNAVVEHNSNIGKYCHISPSATVLGFATVGDFSQVGAGATVLENRIVGENVFVGAGAVITKDTENNKVYVGIPAKPAEK